MEKWKDNRPIKIGKNGITSECVLATILSFVLLSSSFSFHEVYSDGFNFENISNLSETEFGFSQLPQIAAVGSNVYVVWQEESFDGGDIFFSASIDSGANFAAPIPLSVPGSGFSQLPQIAAVGSNVYVVWQEESFDGGDIFFSASIDSGANFAVPIPLSVPGSGFSQLPQIAAVDSNVYVIWSELAADSQGLFFGRSTTNGETFDAPIPLTKSFFDGSVVAIGDADEVAAFSLVAFTGNEMHEDSGVTPSVFDVHETVYKDADSNNLVSEGDTRLANAASSTDFGFPINQQIAAVDANVYVVWEDDGPGEPDIFFIASTDSGANFEPYVNLSSTDPTSITPQIAVVDSNVYVVWQDYATGVAEIFFTASSNNGQDFGEPIPISHVEPGRFSELPQIAAMDSDVYVVWQDNDLVSESDIFFTASSNDGQDFGKPIHLSMNEGLSIFPQLDTSGQNINVVWEDDTTGQKEVFFVASPDAGSSFSTISQVSDADDDSGMPKIAVQGSDCHIVWEDSSLGIPDIFYRHCIEVPTEIKFDFSPYKLGDIATITIIDKSSAGLGVINADVSTTSGGNIPLFELSESDTNPGEFTGQLSFTSGESSSTEVHAEPGDFITVTLGKVSNSASIYPIIVEFGNPSYSITESALVKVTDQNANKDIDVEEEISINITSSANPDVIPLTLIETDSNTGIFENKDLISIQVANGDIITATYSGESDDFFVSPGSGPGRIPGGGLKGTGLVLDAIAGIFGGNSGGRNPPSFGTSSFAIITGGEEGFGGIINDNNVNTLEVTKTFKVGEKAVLRFDFTQGGGIGNIEHIGLYTNVRDGQKRQDSDAYIYYDPLKSSPVTVHDPNGLFSEANFDLLQKDATHFALKFDLTFAKPMAKSDLILESWNIKKWSSVNKIPNAIEVISSGILQEKESEPVKTFQEDVTDDKVIPVWIKSNAKWWSDDEIDNQNFISGIEYLVNEGIIKVSLTETTDTSISEIPPWIKNNAGWWADGTISDDEFLQGIEWLVKNRIIII